MTPYPDKTWKSFFPVKKCANWNLLASCSIWRALIFCRYGIKKLCFGTPLRTAAEDELELADADDTFSASTSRKTAVEWVWLFLTWSTKLFLTVGGPLMKTSDNTFLLSIGRTLGKSYTISALLRHCYQGYNPGKKVFSYPQFSWKASCQTAYSESTNCRQTDRLRSLIWQTEFAQPLVNFGVCCNGYNICFICRIFKIIQTKLTRSIKCDGYTTSNMYLTDNTVKLKICTAALVLFFFLHYSRVLVRLRKPNKFVWITVDFSWLFTVRFGRSLPSFSYYNSKFRSW